MRVPYLPDPMLPPGCTNGEHPCKCGCGTLVHVADVRGRLRFYVSGHHGRRPIGERFWPKVRKEVNCWIWTAGHDGCGYGVVRDGVESRAHRVSWRIHNGAIPAGMRVLHRCDNPPCVNPDHLFLGTQADNMRDAAIKGRPVHKLTPAQVRQIRARYVPYRTDYQAIAREFGISPQYVQNVVLRKRRKHV